MQKVTEQSSSTPEWFYLFANSLDRVGYTITKYPRFGILTYGYQNPVTILVNVRYDFANLSRNLIHYRITSAFGYGRDEWQWVAQSTGVTADGNISPCPQRRSSKVTSPISLLLFASFMYVILIRLFASVIKTFLRLIPLYLLLSRSLLWSTSPTFAIFRVHRLSAPATHRWETVHISSVTWVTIATPI